MSNLRNHYDFIVCGAGPAGCALTARLAENPNVSVLLVEAGGSDDVPEVTTPAQWPLNLGSDRDWQFVAQPNPHLNGRAIPLNMGKVLGGGSSINVMVWARGHQSDWDGFAEETGDDAWSYRAMLDVYRRVEAWHGDPDPVRRGTEGPVHVETPREPQPVAVAMIDAAKSLGIPTFASPNGAMMEGRGGVPEHGWMVFAGLSHPKSRGSLHLTGPDIDDPIRIDANTLSHPDDLHAARATIELGRELAHTRAFEPLLKREALPGKLGPSEMERYIRDSAVTYWHQACTAKMGRDPMSVVNSRLEVYGINRLRIADASIMPSLPSGNTMAPCVAIGERAAELVRTAHGI